MIRPHFSATLVGDVQVEAHGGGPGLVQTVIRDHNADVGHGLGLYLYGTIDQLLAVAEGIRDAVHLLEMQTMSGRVEADVARTAEVGG